MMPHFEWMKKYPAMMWIFLFVLFGSIVLFSLSVGIEELGFSELCVFLASLLSGKEVPEDYSVIFLDIRLARTVLALIAGAGLALAGAGTQAVLCNPLVSPSVLGLSAGASLGASIAILWGQILGFGNSTIFLIACAFAGAMFAVGLCCVLAFSRHASQETIVLAGIAVSYIFSGVLIFLQYHAPYTELRTMLFWAVGSLWNADWNSVYWLLPVLVMGFLFLYAFSLSLDSLAYGEEFSLSVGVNVRKIRLLVLVFSAFLCASVVAFTGAIGFIGLLSPHIARSLFGLGHRVLLPCAMLVGALLLLGADSMARLFFFPEEMPVGAMTSMIGGPFFLYLLMKRKRDWWG